MRGKIYTVHGFTGTLREISEHFKIRYNTLNTRIRLGWSLEMATLTPVDKLKSVRTPTNLMVGEVSDSPEKIEKRFGVILDSKARLSSAIATKVIRKYQQPKVYMVGKKYKGTLKAISADYHCPLSELISGINNGKTVGEILMEGKYFSQK